MEEFRRAWRAWGSKSWSWGPIVGDSVAVALCDRVVGDCGLQIVLRGGDRGHWLSIGTWEVSWGGLLGWWGTRDGACGGTGGLSAGGMAALSRLAAPSLSAGIEVPGVGSVSRPFAPI